VSAELTPRRAPQWLEDLLAGPAVAIGPGELAKCKAWAASALWESGGMDLWAAQAANGTGADRSPELEVIPAAKLLRRRLCEGALLRLAQRLLENARTGEGLDFLEQALRLAPEAQDAAAPLARAAELLRGMPEQALPPCVNALLARGALQNDEQEEGLRHLAAIADGAELPLAVAAPLVVMLAGRGLRAEGRRIADMMSLSPGRAALMPPLRVFEAIGALVQTESHPQARALFAAINPHRLHSIELQGEHMAYLIRFGQPERAAAMADTLAGRSQVWRELHLYHCFALMLLGRHADALNALDRDAERNGPRDQNIIYRAQILWETGALRQSVHVLDEGLDLLSNAHPHSRAMLLHQKGLAQRSLGEVDAALDNLARAEELYPDNWRTSFELALCQRYGGMADSAMETARRGAGRTLFVNNLCPFFEEVLTNAKGGGILCAQSARRCLDLAKNYSAPWLPPRLWAAITALRSLHALGLRKELAAGAGMFASWPPAANAADAAERARVCAALASGAVFTDPAWARRFARSCRPGMPESGFDWQMLAGGRV